MIAIQIPDEHIKSIRHAKKLFGGVILEVINSEDADSETAV